MSMTLKQLLAPYTRMQDNGEFSPQTGGLQLNFANPDAEIAPGLTTRSLAQRVSNGSWRGSMDPNQIVPDSELKGDSGGSIQELMSVLAMAAPVVGSVVAGAGGALTSGGGMVDPNLDFYNNLDTWSGNERYDPSSGGTPTDAGSSEIWKEAIDASSGSGLKDLISNPANVLKLAGMLGMAPAAVARMLSGANADGGSALMNLLGRVGVAGLNSKIYDKASQDTKDNIRMILDRADPFKQEGRTQYRDALPGALNNLRDIVNRGPQLDPELLRERANPFATDLSNRGPNYMENEAKKRLAEGNPIMGEFLKRLHGVNPFEAEATGPRRDNLFKDPLQDLLKNPQNFFDTNPYAVASRKTANSLASGLLGRTGNAGFSLDESLNKWQEAVNKAYGDQLSTVERGFNNFEGQETSRLTSARDAMDKYAGRTNEMGTLANNYDSNTGNFARLGNDYETNTNTLRDLVQKFKTSEDNRIRDYRAEQGNVFKTQVLGAGSNADTTLKASGLDQNMNGVVGPALDAANKGVSLGLEKFRGLGDLIGGATTPDVFGNTMLGSGFNFLQNWVNGGMNDGKSFLGGDGVGDLTKNKDPDVTGGHWGFVNGVRTWIPHG